MLRPDWDVRTGVGSAVDDRSLEEIWRYRNGPRRNSPEIALRSPRQEAASVNQLSAGRDAHLSVVKPLEGALLRKLFKATVEEKRRAAVEAKIWRSKFQVRRDQGVGEDGAEAEVPKIEGFYLPRDMILSKKENNVAPKAMNDSSLPHVGSRETPEAKGLVVDEQPPEDPVDPARVPPEGRLSKKAAKKAANRNMVHEQKVAKPDAALASETGAPGQGEKKRKGKSRADAEQEERPADAPHSEHASVEMRSWVELGEQTLLSADHRAKGHTDFEGDSGQPRADWGAHESRESASRSSSNKNALNERDQTTLSVRDTPQSETRPASREDGNTQSIRSRSQMQATAESEASHSPTPRRRSNRKHRSIADVSEPHSVRTSSKDDDKENCEKTSPLEELIEMTKSWISSGHTSKNRPSHEDAWVKVKSSKERSTASPSKSSKNDDHHTSQGSSRWRKRDHLRDAEIDPEIRTKPTGSGGASENYHRSSRRPRREKHGSPNHSALKSHEDSSSERAQASPRSSNRSSRFDRRTEEAQIAQSESRLQTPSPRRTNNGSKRSSRHSHSAEWNIDNLGLVEPTEDRMELEKTSSQISRASRHSSAQSRTTEQLENAYLETAIAENLAESELMGARQRSSSRRSTDSSQQRSHRTSGGLDRPNLDEKGLDDVDYQDWAASRLSARTQGANNSDSSGRSLGSSRRASEHSSRQSHERAPHIHLSSNYGPDSKASDPYASRRRHASPRTSKHSSIQSSRHSLVGTPIYGIVSTTGHQEGLVSVAQNSNISDRRSEQPQRQRPTVFAGKGWISPHPLSRSPTDFASPPQTKIVLPSNAHRHGATMTYEEWLTIQEDGLRKHRNFSFTESSQTWHARQQDERYRFPGWEARSWVEVEASPAESYAFSDSYHSDPTVRTIGSQESSHPSGPAPSRGHESRRSTMSYHPALPPPTQSELVWQEMEEGHGGW